MRLIRTYRESCAYDSAVSPVLSADFSVSAGVSWCSSLSGDISGKGLEEEGAGRITLSLTTHIETFVTYE